MKLEKYYQRCPFKPTELLINENLVNSRQFSIPHYDF